MEGCSKGSGEYSVSFSQYGLRLIRLLTMEGPREGEGALLLVVTEGEAGEGTNEEEMLGVVGGDVMERKRVIADGALLDCFIFCCHIHSLLVC